MTHASKAVTDLVARFREHADAYHAGRYNETQIRREFIDPFFKALGWDVWNEQSYAEAYKDVIHEDAINVGGATKAPDYCFRIGGVRKFFVEAKKPSVDIKADAGPAFQLRRYAWSAKLPLSILTDFEELAVYDCRVKPVRSDKASTARVLYFRYDEYSQRWDELASVFAREAILKGSFDKYAESSKRKRGTAEVDDAFLAEIEQWRDMLARNLALRNPGLTQRDLNFAVQRTIDRIVFLRICEDRGIERYGTLQALCATQTEPRASARGQAEPEVQGVGPVAHAPGSDSGKIYERLFTLFRRADERYNSGLFHFSRERGRPEQPDDLTPGLTIDDKPLKDILARLYYPESPYEFSVLPADILGQVYEQFLGKVIRLTKGHRAVVEEKPEVRKAGGVYYTPTYIVDYIVKHTVGKLVEGKTPQQVGGLTDTFQPSKAKGVRPLTVLDPACGSGSFLLGAYQFLLDWYRDRYLEDGPETHAAGRNPRLFQHPSGDWRLTTAERKRILLAHIHGVDIDSQAVETTKLSLLLKVLEGESAETIGSSLRLFHERALPDLAANIKCGNSLIGPDFYDGQQMGIFDEEERLRINVFDWHAEFPEVFVASGPRTGRPEQYPERQRRAEQYPERKRRAKHTAASDGVGPVADARGSDQGLDPHSGFDAVIGNPPYVRMETFKPIKNYLRERYACHDERADLYAYFVERGVSLLDTAGIYGMILSNKFIKAKYGKPLRLFLAGNGIVDTVADFAGAPVFAGATVRTIVLILRRSHWKDRVAPVYIPVPDADALCAMAAGRLPVDQYGAQTSRAMDPREFSSADWRLIPGAHTRVLDHLTSANGLLSEWVGSTALFGLKTGLNQALVIDTSTRNRLVKTDPRCAEILRPILFGKDVRRYWIRDEGRFVIYCHPDRAITEYPAVEGYLRPFKRALARRAGKQAWYELQQPAVALLEHMNRPRIVYPIIANECRFTLDTESRCINDKLFLLPSGATALLGVLNSRLANFYFAAVCAALEGRAERYLEFRAQYVDKFPVPTALSNRHSRGSLESLATHLLDLHKQLAAAKTAHAKTAIQRQIDATDRQIDQLVYELYGLTDDEIRIVEEATR